MKKAGDILGSFLDSNILNKAKEYSGLFSAWKLIAGDHIACHSHIIELDKNLLIIEAEHPSWIQLIQLKQKHILYEVNKRFPELKVTGIAIRLQKEGGWEKKHISVEIEQVSADTSAPTVSQDADPYACISDESFKDQLKRLEKTITTQKRFK